MSKRLHLSLLLLTAMGCLVSAGARDVQDLSSTKDGKGNIKYASRAGNLDVGRVRVTLRRGGAAEIQLMSGANETFYGRWTNAGRHACRLTVERLGSDRASGKGMLMHDDNGNFRNVELQGSARGARFEFNFHAENDSRGGIDSIASARDGDGTVDFRSRSRNNDISRVRVTLQRDGAFEVRIERGATETWRGTWREDGRNRARLDIDRIGGDNATGTGSVDLDGRGSFNRVTLNGNGGGARFNLDFRAGDVQNKPTFGNDFRGFSTSHRGEGSFGYDRRTRQPNECRVVLKDDNTFRVSFSGDGAENFSGTWRLDGNTARLEVTDGVGWNGTNGSGTVNLTRDRRDWTAITLSGSGKNGRYTFAFRV